MSKWIAEFELEDGDRMPEHMDLEYHGVKLDFHCRPLEQEPCEDAVSRKSVITIIQNHWWNCRDIDKLVNELPPVTPQESRWIPVSEKYPKPEDEYKHFLVTDDKGKVSIQEFYLSLDEEPQPYFSGLVNVIAWMPLPEPYKEDKE